jgi:hypothetical protein
MVRKNEGFSGIPNIPELGANWQMIVPAVVFDEGSRDGAYDYDYQQYA